MTQLTEGPLVVAVNVTEVPAAAAVGCGETLRVYAGGVMEMLPTPPPQLRRKALVERTTNETERRKTRMLTSQIPASIPVRHCEDQIITVHLAW
jgi:hypothetical protein